MSLRGLLLLFVLLALVAAALVFWRGPKEETKTPVDEAPLIAAFDEGSVRSITTGCDDASYLLRRTATGGWTLGAPQPTEADPREVHTLLEALRGARVRKVIAERGVDASAFGLDPETCTVRLEIQGDAAGRTLTIGHTSPVGYERYARGADGRVVFIDGTLYTALARPADTFRERRLLPLDPQGVSRLTIERPAGRVVLAREEGVWRLEEPVRDAADRFETERAVDAATSLQIEHEEAPERPPHASRERRIVVTADALTAYVAAAGVGGKRLAWREHGDTIGLVAESALADLDRPAAAFRDRQVLSFSSPDARRVVVTRGAMSLTLSRASEKDPWTGQDGAETPGEVDGARVTALLDRLRGVRALGVEDGAPPTAPTGTLAVSGEAGDLARASWGPLPPRDAEEAVWVTTPGREGTYFRVLASSFGPVPSGRKDLVAP